ncbi:tetratricopeptide repeat protein [Roseovarius tibetensis]|uniref:tetratricopeptide repeat protein n=1 Tax=Roseovarius tibetensis TaxID=2685897 RepID=UPI003D7F4346
MSETDGFIEEVTEEVRRDRLFRLMRRYGWIAVLLILVLVGGAAWNEWRKAQAEDAAQAFGDSILAALSQPDRAARASALAEIDAPNPEAAAVVDLLAAGEVAEGDPESAAARLLSITEQAETADVYRQIATLKAVTLPQSGLSVDTRRQRLEALVSEGGVIRLLAEEQLALIALETGDRSAALERLTAIAADAEATAGLRRRATQVIVALGEDPPNTSGASPGAAGMLQ